MKPLFLLLHAAALTSRAEPGVPSAQGLIESARAQKATNCSAATELREFASVPCTEYGDFTQKDLVAVAKTVFGEASAEPAEQCAVALTIFNRARAEHKPLSAIVRSPGQFEGSASKDRLECVKLKGAVAAVKTLAVGKSCSFGKRRFKYFCSAAGWNRVKKNRKASSENAEIIGETSFLVNGPC